MHNQYTPPRNGADARDVLTPVVGDGANYFDDQENRNDVFSESVVPRNTITHVPYRGNEQHGVEFNTPAGDFQPYASEQAAQEQVIRDDITPRDPANIAPIRVKVIDSPDLLYRRVARATNFIVNADNLGVWINVAQPNAMRKRIIVTTSVIAVGSVILANVALSDSSPDDMNSFIYRGGSITTTVIDSSYTGGVWVKVFQITASSTQSIGVVQEYVVTDGDPLL